MEFELATRMRPQAVEILGLVESAATGPVDRARGPTAWISRPPRSCWPLWTGAAAGSWTYLRQVGAAEGRKPYLLAQEGGA